jgi:phycocyanobilin:ferredoxin oxidoreductase
MSYNQILNNIADSIESVIIDSDATLIPTEDFGWVNKRYQSNEFRLAHIERYSDKNLEVLHITCFPNESYQHPIFGFDVICTEKKPLAAFMDWSPVDNTLSSYIGYEFEKNYPLPEWAKIIFSQNALAVIPNDNELNKISEIVTNNFKQYIQILKGSKQSEHRIGYISAAQNRYCENQQKNERTYNVLKAKLGEHTAKYFMENILFPKINKI